MITDIEQCLHQLVFALKIKGCIEAKLISKSAIDVDFELEGTGLSFGAGTWDSHDSMVILAENAVNMAIAALAIAGDEELDKALGHKDPLRTEYPFNLRAVIYQIRNCFAHSLLRPTYRVKGGYSRSYRLDFLPGQPLINFRSLDKELFSYEHFGGICNFWSLFHEAQKLTPRPNATLHSDCTRTYPA